MPLTTLNTIEKHKLANSTNLQKRTEAWVLKWASDIMNATPTLYKAEEYRKLTEVAQAILNNSSQYLPAVCKAIAFVGTINYKINTPLETDGLGVITYEGTNEDNDIQFTVNSVMPAICGVTMKNKL